MLDEPSEWAMLPANEFSAQLSTLSYERRILAAKLFFAALYMKSAKRMSADIMTPLRRNFPSLLLKGTFVFLAKLTPPCFYHFLCARSCAKYLYILNIPHIPPKRQ